MTLPHIQSLQPDLFGRITVMDEGRPRTFLKDKLIDYLKKAIQNERLQTIGETSEFDFDEQTD